MSSKLLGKVGEESGEGCSTEDIAGWRGEGSSLQAGQHDIKAESAAPRHPRVPPFLEHPIAAYGSITGHPAWVHKFLSPQHTLSPKCPLNL
jgi:hypothetical protein